jgi:diguanylate cyclase (GGDEF)-like protein
MQLDKQKILIAEDNPEFVDLLKSVLGQKYILEFSKTGNDVLNFEDRKQPDLILLETRLSDADSFEICSRLRADSRTYRIPVILLANSEKEIDLESFAAGALDYIIRPIHPTILKARVGIYLELKRFRDDQDGQETTDNLTGIPNRHQLEDQLNCEWRRAIRYQTPLSLIVMDIDFFMAFNNCYGRSVGNYCLQEIASVLDNNLKRETDCVARYGGDEFAYLLPATNAGGAIQVAHKVQEIIENLNIPHAGSPITDHVTLSFGVATMRPRPSLEPADLIQQAASHLGEAKRDGHNQIRFRQGYYNSGID